MKAGRELDALVAEHVMGWVWGIDDDGFQYLVPADWDEYMVPAVPHYSTRIQDAWQVVEKTKLLDDFELTKDGPMYQFGHYGEYGFDEWTLYAEADTAPLAICLAALKAVGYED